LNTRPSPARLDESLGRRLPATPYPLVHHRNSRTGVTAPLVSLQRAATSLPSWWRREGSTQDSCWRTALQLPWVSGLCCLTILERKS